MHIVLNWSRSEAIFCLRHCNRNAPLPHDILCIVTSFTLGSRKVNKHSKELWKEYTLFMHVRTAGVCDMHTTRIRGAKALWKRAFTSYGSTWAPSNPTFRRRVKILSALVLLPNCSSDLPFGAPLRNCPFHPSPPRNGSILDRAGMKAGPVHLYLCFSWQRFELIQEMCMGWMDMWCAAWTMSFGKLRVHSSFVGVCECVFPSIRTKSVE